ncbi:MAG: xanthine dehydrogenase family protein subunit M [Acidimicrobiales bacterium]|nr:xanthine dehydrogenase family protein subunit M [Acidimicrobiales bacterium]
MIPAKFDYVAVDSAEAALAALTEHGDEAKLMAGGHSLIPLMKFRLATPTVVIDIGRIQDLSYIKDAGDHVAIGALTRHMMVEKSDLLKAEVPLLAHCASQVGDPSVRHRGTIGGSLAHADAASDLPAALLALRGSVMVTGPNGAREVKADDLFAGFLENSLADDEMITEVRVPKAAGAGWSYQKFNRRAQDWAIVGVAALLNGSAGVSLVNMGPTPMRASGVEEALGGGASASDAAQHAADGGDPPTDLNGDAEYRTHLSKVLVERALTEAASRKA